MDIGNRQKICQLVAGIILADDNLDHKEEDLVDRLVRSFDVEDVGRDVIFPLLDRSEAAKQFKELPKDAQDAALALLVEAACVDGQIASEERKYLNEFATVLGIPESELANRVADQLGAAAKAV